MFKWFNRFDINCYVETFCIARLIKKNTCDAVFVTFFSITHIVAYGTEIWFNMEVISYNIDKLYFAFQQSITKIYLSGFLITERLYIHITDVLTITY